MPQELINYIGAIALAVSGWFARELWSAVNELKKDLAKLREELPQDYIAKIDYRDDIRQIKEMLVRIDEKMDSKADK